MEKTPGRNQSLKHSSAGYRAQFGNPDGGNLAVAISEPAVEVRADFIPPAAGGSPFTMDDVSSALDDLNVVYGVRRENIEKALAECNLGRVTVKDVIIAAGDPPVNEIAEYYEKNPEFKISDIKDDESQIDHRQKSPFVIVKKDQALAILKPRKPGQEGKNVHGDALPFKLIKPEGVTGGENTRIENGFILSNIHGQLLENKKILRVQNTLVIKGSVDYSTGHINFPGDVQIDGTVSDGFKIHSAGSITIKQTFDVTEAVAKGDLSVAGGIIGRGSGLLKAGGGIRTRFIVNCRAASRETVFVEREINNSSVYTLAKIEMGDRGLILGSEIFCVNGLRAAGIGKKAGKATRIHCGVDFTVKQELERNNAQLRILAVKKEKLKELMNDDKYSEKRAGMDEALERIEAEQARIGKRISEMLGKVIIDEDAVVEVSGEISRGTLIEICQVALFVDEPLRRVRIRLDRTSGRLAADPL